MNYKQLASGLKSTTFKCITNDDEVYAYENYGKIIIKELYKFYVKNTEYLPPEYRADNIINQYSGYYKDESRDSGLKQGLQKRLVVDYISGMMDEYAKKTYNKIKR